MNNWYDLLSMTQVTHRLYVSGQARAAELAASNPHKITAVLCVHQTMDYKQSPGIVYMHVPFDDGSPIPEKQFVKCLGWLKFMHENGHTILVHCAAGISRSVTILAAFMHYEGIMDFNDALDRIKMNRPNASPAPAVSRSAKQMLKVPPYDGTYDAPSPEHEKIMSSLIERVQDMRAASAHPNPDCTMRQFLLGSHETNEPRHTIPCNCEKLVSPLEIAAQKDSIIITPGIEGCE